MPKVNGFEIHKNRVWIYFSNWAKIIVLHNAWQVQIDIRMMANSTDGEHSLHSLPPPTLPALLRATAQYSKKKKTTKTTKKPEAFSTVIPKVAPFSSSI